MKNYFYKVIQVETAKETIEQSEIPYETVKEMTEGALIQTNELMSKKKILENLHIRAMALL